LILVQLLFTAFAGATFSVAIAAIAGWRRYRRRAKERHESRNQKKVFHKILLFSFVEALGHEFRSRRADS